MSREVRRVPVGWQHPVEPNPHCRFQQEGRIRRGEPESKLHPPEMQFVSLCDDYPGALDRWQREGADLASRTGRSWEWNVEYHLTGYQGQQDTEPVAHPFYIGEEESVVVRDEDHLHELLTRQHAGERPNPDDYMPVFDQPEDELGWCLYQTVSEGTPVTPAFATAEELIEHLCTVGQDWDQQPMRRAAAEQLVRSGHSLGSFVVTGGQLLRSDHDADLIAGASA